MHISARFGHPRKLYGLALLAVGKRRLGEEGWEESVGGRVSTLDTTSAVWTSSYPGSTFLT